MGIKQSHSAVDMIVWGLWCRAWMHLFQRNCLSQRFANVEPTKTDSHNAVCTGQSNVCLVWRCQSTWRRRRRKQKHGSSVYANCTGMLLCLPFCHAIDHTVFPIFSTHLRAYVWRPEYSKRRYTSWVVRQTQPVWLRVRTVPVTWVACPAQVSLYAAGSLIAVVQCRSDSKRYCSLNGIRLSFAGGILVGRTCCLGSVFVAWLHCTVVADWFDCSGRMLVACTQALLADRAFGHRLVALWVRPVAWLQSKLINFSLIFEKTDKYFDFRLNHRRIVPCCCWLCFLIGCLAWFQIAFVCILLVCLLVDWWIEVLWRIGCGRKHLWNWYWWAWHLWKWCAHWIGKCLLLCRLWCIYVWIRSCLAIANLGNILLLLICRL